MISWQKYQNRSLQLLLTHIQNGITKNWQRIPSVMAMFAAEASFILLDPSQNHFLTLTEYLMRSKTMDLEVFFYLCLKKCNSLFDVIWHCSPCCRWHHLWVTISLHRQSHCFWSCLEVVPFISKAIACGFSVCCMQDWTQILMPKSIWSKTFRTSCWVLIPLCSQIMMRRFWY